MEQQPNVGSIGKSPSARNCIIRCENSLTQQLLCLNILEGGGQKLNDTYLEDLATRWRDENGRRNGADFKCFWRRRLSIQLLKCNSKAISRKIAKLAKTCARNSCTNDDRLDMQAWLLAVLQRIANIFLKVGALYSVDVSFLSYNKSIRLSVCLPLSPTSYFVCIRPMLQYKHQPN